MKLRKPCVHGRYEEHVDIPERDSSDPIGTIRGPFFPCPGGVFLPDDTLIVEKENGEWPGWAKQAVRYEANGLAGQVERILDALSVRESS